MRLRDDVLVLHGQDGDVETRHGARSTREAAGRRHHVFADYVALVRAHEPLAAGPFLDGRDGGLAVDRRARSTRPAGQRLGEVGGLHVAVARVADGADQAIGHGQRPDFAHLVRVKELDLDADGAGHARVLAVLVHAIGGHRQADVANQAQADILAGFGFQSPVEGDGVLVQLSNRVAHVEQRQQTGGVPGRAGGQLLAFHEHDIGPPLAGQVIETRYADDAAADDDYARMRLHRPLRFAPRVSVPPLKCVDITFVPDGEPGMCASTCFDGGTSSPRVAPDYGCDAV